MIPKNSLLNKLAIPYFELIALRAINLIVPFIITLISSITIVFEGFYVYYDRLPFIAIAFLIYSALLATQAAGWVFSKAMWWIDDFEGSCPENPFTYFARSLIGLERRNNLITHPEVSDDIMEPELATYLALVVLSVTSLAILVWHYTVEGVVSAFLAAVCYGYRKKRRYQKSIETMKIIPVPDNDTSVGLPLLPNWSFTRISKVIEQLDRSLDEQRISFVIETDHPIRSAMHYIACENRGNDVLYHSNQHMFGTAVIANYLYVKGDGRYCPYEHVTLILSSLLHDIWHSGGNTNDAENIKRVLDNLPKHFLDYRPEMSRSIQCTEYPFIKEPRSYNEECLRDADILYATLMGDPKIIMEDLRKEIEVSQARNISYREMLDGQRAFSENVKFYTELGKRLYEARQPAFMQALEHYVSEKSEK